MEISSQENNSWKGSSSEQVLWYGDPYPYQNYQNPMPVYTQAHQYQQSGQAYWNPNASVPERPFAALPPTSPAAQEKLRVPPYQAPQPAARMPKAQALSLARNVKKGALILSLAVFGVLTVLVAGNLKITSAAPSFPNQGTDPSQSNSNDPNAGNYFQHGDGGGYGFGNNGSNQNPGTGTSVS